MTFLHSIKNALKRPYPIAETIGEEVRGMIIASAIVTAILFFFRPFGMQNLTESVFFISLAFGGVTFMVGLIYSMVTRFVFKKYGDLESQTLGFWILHVLGLIVCIAIGNVLFLLTFLGESFSFEVLMYNLLSTALIGIFPVTFFGFQNQINLEKKNTQKAKEIYERLIAQHGTTKSSEKVFLAIRAMENYIHVYESKDGNISKTTKRQTLQSAGNEEQYSALIKCHRSYLFNPDEVYQVDGNAQGLKLTMSHPECPIIPVSRSYIEIVRSCIHT